jgi:hypothetical protein
MLLMADNSVADGMVPSASSTTLSFDEEHAWKPTGMESNAIILLRFRGFDPMYVGLCHHASRDWSSCGYREKREVACERAWKLFPSLHGLYSSSR